MQEKGLFAAVLHTQKGTDSPKQTPECPGNATVPPARALDAIGSWPAGLALCALGFVLCILLTVTPLTRLRDSLVHFQIAAGTQLARAGNWLPINLGPGSTPRDVQGNTAYIEFLLLILLAFLCYGCGAWLVGRRAARKRPRVVCGLIFLGAVMAGAIYVVTPAMLSHDIVVYASYSHLLATYHANPYFVPISIFPRDPLTAINYWARAVSAYGPIWLFVCGFWGHVLGADLATYILMFRLLALAMHLLNIWLVGCILSALGRSPNTVTAGMLLYAWNPLVLLESALGGHNDVFMLTFALTGILLAARAERHGRSLQVWGYLPPVMAFTLATLVKITSLPILAAYLLFLACKALYPVRTFTQALRNCLTTLLVLGGSMLVAMLVALALYAPFWLGHSPQEIAASFKSLPSVSLSANSYMWSLIFWLHNQPPKTPLLQLLVQRSFWDHLVYVAIGFSLFLGSIALWLRPTIKNFALVALATMDVVLLLTPWFYSWYITWIMGLAVVCLPMRQRRIEAALLAFTITFSFSALLTYLFKDRYQPFGSQEYLVSLATTLPPICAFLATLILWQPARSQITGDTER